jgi:succinoglycan biosynthesis protein ExoW
LVVRTISVIIPFFQREPGILSRALNSIQSQTIPDGWAIEVIIIDDASPCPAHHEVRDMHWREPLRLKVVRQENRGVAAARNRGLEEAHNSATVIAFLDSDDMWPPNHLAHAIQAIDEGFDFYFTDNRRQGFHKSHVHTFCGQETGRFIAASQQKSGILAIPTDVMVGLVVQEFPTQASTIVYNFSIAPLLRFNTDLKAAGEDMLFFTALTSKATRVGFDLDSIVECGGGLNMYFGNLGWDSPKCMAIRVDQLIAHRLIGTMANLSPETKKRNAAVVIVCRRELAFHTGRNLMKYPARVPKAIFRLLRSDPGAALMLPIDMIVVALSQIFGSSRGKTEERRA